MKKILLATIGTITLATVAQAEEWEYAVEGHAQALYGYTDVKKHNHSAGQGNIDSSITYNMDADTNLSAHLDLTGGIDQEIQDNNQGRWGEEVYGVVDSLYGQIILGQTTNVASLFHNGAPSAGAVSSNNDIADFLHNPDWKRNKKQTYFATLNSTDINTDGVAPKISYITPELYGTAVGFSYMPNSYNRKGLINKHAGYAHKDGFVGAVYNDYDWGAVSTQTAFGYAQYHGNDKEFSYSLRLSRGNWSLGGGYRKTYTDGDNKISNGENMPDLFDGYREGQAWNIGLGFEFGPFKSALTYFEAEAKNKDNEAKTVSLSNEYQINKHFDIYAAAAYGMYDTSLDKVDGYAFITGIGVNF